MGLLFTLAVVGALIFVTVTSDPDPYRPGPLTQEENGAAAGRESAPDAKVSGTGAASSSHLLGAPRDASDRSTVAAGIGTPNHGFLDAGSAAQSSGKGGGNGMGISAGPSPSDLRHLGAGSRNVADGGVQASRAEPAKAPPSSTMRTTGHDADVAAAVEHDRKTDHPDGSVPARPKIEEADNHNRRSVRSEDGEELRRVTRFVATGGATLKGRILETDNERPVVNAIIEARMDSTYVETRTDAAGLFRIPGMVPTSRITIWVQSETNSFVAESAEVVLLGEGEITDAGTIHVLRGNEFGGNLGGWIGMFVGRRGGVLSVKAVNPWLPAERAGIQVGDRLLFVDGRDVRELGTRGINYLLRGPVGSKVTLVVQSNGAGSRKVTLERVQR